MSETWPEKAYRWVLIAGVLVSLAANLPGHLSTDSVVALEQAHTHVRQTWAPAAFSGVLHFFYHFLASTGLYVSASTAVLAGAWLSLPGLRGRASWLAVVVAGLILLTPQLLLYQGIVWRDVLFANVTLAGFVLLARAERDWPVRRDWVSLAAAALLLALGAAVRQNGLVLVLAAALALAWTARRGGWRAAAAWGAGGFVLTLVLAFAINLAASPHNQAANLRSGAEALILQHYDIVGAVAHDPSLPLTAIAAANPSAAARIASEGPKIYTPARIDTLDRDPDFRRALWKLPDAAVGAQWRDIILHHPADYLAHRLEAFRWLLLTPDLAQCLPVQTGIEGPPDMLDDLGLKAGQSPKNRALAAYAQAFEGTPVYSHLVYAVIALVAAGVLLFRRQGGDVAMAALLLGALAFAASFLVISVACDYRYLYLLDLSAMTGLIYLALDPPWASRRRA